MRGRPGPGRSPRRGSLAKPPELGLGAVAKGLEIFFGAGAVTTRAATARTAARTAAPESARHGRSPKDRCGASANPAEENHGRDTQTQECGREWRDPDNEVEAFRLRRAENNLAVLRDELGRDLV